MYCCTPKALYNHVGGLSSTTTSVQHPPGKDGSVKREHWVGISPIIPCWLSQHEIRGAGRLSVTYEVSKQPGKCDSMTGTFLMAAAAYCPTAALREACSSEKWSRDQRRQDTESVGLSRHTKGAQKRALLLIWDQCVAAIHHIWHSHGVHDGVCLEQKDCVEIACFIFVNCIHFLVLFNFIYCYFSIYTI